MTIRSIIKKIVYKYCTLRLLRKVTAKGNSYAFGPHASVTLSDGSSSSDIIIGNHFRLHGELYSQNHGKIIIGEYTDIGLNCSIRSVNNISIGSYVGIAANVIITDNNTHSISPEFRRLRRVQPATSIMHKWRYSDNAPVVVEDNVWIGENARICKGVTIGKNSVIGANSVVTKNVPANCVAVGNPARVVKENIDRIPAPEEFAELMKNVASF